MTLAPAASSVAPIFVESPTSLDRSSTSSPASVLETTTKDHVIVFSTLEPESIQPALEFLHDESIETATLHDEHDIQINATEAGFFAFEWKSLGS